MNHKISKIVIATHNAGKIKEFQYLLKPYKIKCYPISNFSNLIPKETGKSFKQNAIIKAINASKISGLPSLADDSGLVIPLLKNKPGIYSARWAKNAGNYYSAMYLIKAKLENMRLPNKKVPAYFICNLTYATTEGILMNYEGKINGKLQFPPIGNSGFGYDPIFIPDGELKTLAQMSNEKKQSLSHRREAFEKFKLDKLI
mgnify:CR=1 FL=1